MCKAPDPAPAPKKITRLSVIDNYNLYKGGLSSVHAGYRRQRPTTNP